MAMRIEYKKAHKLDDLLVDSREDQALLAHRESPSEGILCLSRSDLESMTGRQLLQRFNAYIDSLLDGIANDRPVEIAEGQPQLKWRQMSRQWTAEGDVLRCVVDWDSDAGEEPGELAIRIDDKLLSGEEFLKVIESYEGWGMRIEFMHPNRLTDPPKPIFGGKERVTLAPGVALGNWHDKREPAGKSGSTPTDKSASKAK